MLRRLSSILWLFAHKKHVLRRMSYFYKQDFFSLYIKQQNIPLSEYCTLLLFRRDVIFHYRNIVHFCCTKNVAYHINLLGQLYLSSMSYWTATHSCQGPKQPSDSLIRSLVIHTLYIHPISKLKLCDKALSVDILLVCTQ